VHNIFTSADTGQYAHTVSCAKHLQPETLC
jgi:hypothetical protein